MKRLPPALLVLALVLSGPAPRVHAQAAMSSAPAVKAAVHFVKPDTLDVAKLLPAPPAPGSLAAQADLDTVLEAQAWRTPDGVAWAKRIEKMTPADYGDVLGLWFAKENLPLTFALLKDLNDDARPMLDASKKLFARPRPFAVDARVQPCVARPTNDSYPSGHSFNINMWAAVLAEIFPDRRAELFDHAHRMGWGRVLGGVHFPTDIVGGRMLAEAFVAELKKNDAFRAAVEKCRAEAQPFLLKKAA